MSEEKELAPQDLVDYKFASINDLKSRVGNLSQMNELERTGLSEPVITRHAKPGCLIHKDVRLFEYKHILEKISD